MTGRARSIRRTAMRFAARRCTRVLAWMLLGGIAGLVAGLTSPYGEIAPAWHAVAAAEGVDYIPTLAWFVYDTLLPFALLAGLTTILFAVGAGLLGLVVALLPHQIATVVDGLAMAAMAMALLQMLDVTALLRSRPAGTLLDLLSIWLLLISLSGLLWNRIPGGLRHRAAATRTVAVPITEVRDRLVPGRNRATALADIAIGGQDPAVPADWQPVITRRDGDDAWRIDEPAGRAPWRQMRLALSAPAPGQTRIAIDMELNALSPLAWWDIATRPYGPDYLDHIEARLTGVKDRSTYGLLATQQRERARKSRSGRRSETGTRQG